MSKKIKNYFNPKNEFDKQLLINDLMLPVYILFFFCIFN